MCKALIEFPVILAHMLSPFCPNFCQYTVTSKMHHSFSFHFNEIWLSGGYIFFGQKKYY